jgi:phage FluMu protein Com
MLARVVAQGLELKCRKCKSLVLITHDELVEMYQRLGLRPSPSHSIPKPPVR